ncbi:hypothetical protein ACP70R_019191 [Stipagrostis hirtigluma subsp. patula]
MRIRKCAARLLGSAYSAAAAPAQGPDAPLPFDLPLPAPPPPPPPCSAAPESLVGVGFPGPAAAAAEPCELSRSPWDLLAELTLSDPQVEDELVDKYFVHVVTRASWLFTASMPSSSATKSKKTSGWDSAQPRREPVKKAQKNLATSKELEMGKKESEAKKKPKVKKEEGAEPRPRVWKCKKNDGKRWHCHRTVSRPNALCDYHFYRKRANGNPEMDSAAAVPGASPAAAAAATKSAASSKPRKKKSGHDFGGSEGFYYYAGFGPFRSKRQCRTSMHDSVPPKQEEESPEEDVAPATQADKGDDTNRRPAAAHDDVSSCDDMGGIAGVDEESSDDDFLGVASGCNVNGNGEPRANNDGDSKKPNPWKKRWRKPVKARSLKSLM